jgi:uncharacterized membrane protein HdeD (DUF308 family)
MDPSARPLRDSALGEDPVRAIAHAVGQLWWVWLLFGIFWIAIAFVVLQFDQASITTVGVLLGFMFLIAGVQQLVISMFAAGWAKWVLVIFGVLLLASALISFIEPKNTFAGVADILGFIFLLIGVFWTVEALAERDVNPLWWVGLVSGIAVVILGFWAAGQFFIDKAYILLVFAGIWALFHGVTDLIKAFQIRRIAREIEAAV